MYLIVQCKYKKNVQNDAKEETKVDNVSAAIFSQFYRSKNRQKCRKTPVMPQSVAVALPAISLVRSFAATSARNAIFLEFKGFFF